MCSIRKFGSSTVLIDTIDVSVVTIIDLSGSNALRTGTEVNAAFKRLTDDSSLFTNLSSIIFRCIVKLLDTSAQFSLSIMSYIRCKIYTFMNVRRLIDL